MIAALACVVCASACDESGQLVRAQIQLVAPISVEAPDTYVGSTSVLFFDVVNSEGDRLPRKHTILVKPAEKASVDLTADAVEVPVVESGKDFVDIHLGDAVRRFRQAVVAQIEPEGAHDLAVIASAAINVRYDLP